MLVKCPKCRLRFDVPASPGITEVQCNCERCGTPFVYTIPAVSSDDAATDGSQASYVQKTTDFSETQNDFARSDRANGADTVPPPLHQGASHGSVYASSQTPSVDHSSSSPGQRMSRPLSAPRIESSSNGLRKRLFIVAACVAAVVVFTIYQCGDDTKSYTAESLQVAETVDDSGEMISSDRTAPDYDPSLGAEKAPAWIQGHWYVETDYGGISVQIRGTNISETSGGQTSRGTFRYQNHYLYCNFGNKDVFTYYLDETRKQIDAGNGMLMRKGMPE